MQPRELYIIGPPRSGTTLLGRLIGGSDGVLSLSEPYLCHSIMSPWQLDRFFYRFEKAAGLRRRRPPLGGTAPQYTRFLRALAGDNGFRWLAIKETYRRDGLKSIWHNEPLLEQLVAGPAPVIALIRHPYDVAASTIRLSRPVTGFRRHVIRLRLPNLPAFAGPTDVVRWAADNWARYGDWARRHQLQLLRYEDVVANPRREIQAVCTRCGIPFTEAMLDGQRRRVAFGGLGDMDTLSKPRAIDRKSVGRGRHLTGEQQLIVRERCGPLARELDYPLTPVAAAPIGTARPAALPDRLTTWLRRLRSGPVGQR